MNSIVSNFTKDLLEKVAKEKKAREPIENRIVLSPEMAEFLEKHRCPGLGKDQKPGLFLKEGRKWPSSRSSRPYSIKIGQKTSSPRKETIKHQASKMMDLEKKG